jgi:hypothetical protein
VHCACGRAKKVPVVNPGVAHEHAGGALASGYNDHHLSGAGAERRRSDVSRVFLADANRRHAMTDAKRAEQTARDAVLKLLSDEETARVSTAETASKLADGAEYVDLEQLDRGVQRARPGAGVTMGHILPRSAVSKETWNKIVAHLAR